MAIFSFIDNNKKDFLRYEDGSAVMISTGTWEGAENWLISNGKQYGWTNTGVKYFNWIEEFPD